MATLDYNKPGTSFKYRWTAEGRAVYFTVTIEEDYEAKVVFTDVEGAPIRKPDDITMLRNDRRFSPIHGTIDTYRLHALDNYSLLVGDVAILQWTMIIEHRTAFGNGLQWIG